MEACCWLFAFAKLFSIATNFCMFTFYLLLGTVEKIKKDGVMGAASSLKGDGASFMESKAAQQTTAKLSSTTKEASSFFGHLAKEFQKDLGIKK